MGKSNETYLKARRDRKKLKFKKIEWNCRIWIGSCGFDSICWTNAIVTTVKTVKESEVL